MWRLFEPVYASEMVLVAMLPPTFRKQLSAAVVLMEMTLSTPSSYG